MADSTDGRETGIDLRGNREDYEAIFGKDGPFSKDPKEVRAAMEAYRIRRRRKYPHLRGRD